MAGHRSPPRSCIPVSLFGALSPLGTFTRSFLCLDNLVPRFRLLLRTFCPNRFFIFVDSLTSSPLPRFSLGKTTPRFFLLRRFFGGFFPLIGPRSF